MVLYKDTQQYTTEHKASAREMRLILPLRELGCSDVQGFFPSFFFASSCNFRLAFQVKDAAITLEPFGIGLLRIHWLLMRNADLHSSPSHYDTTQAVKAGDIDKDEDRAALWSVLLTGTYMTLHQYNPVLTKEAQTSN